MGVKVDFDANVFICIDSQMYRCYSYGVFIGRFVLLSFFQHRAAVSNSTALNLTRYHRNGNRQDQITPFMGWR